MDFARDRFACRWEPTQRRGAVWLAAGLIALATLAAYSNTLRVPLIFDDLPAIVDNRSIRQLWPITVLLSPPTHGEAVSGRPLLNVSFALNYALGGTDPLGYHVVNLAIHLAAALVLFGLLRRTLLRDSAAPTAVAAIIALIWAIHPLQTESVTYTVQRAESLMGLFYLLTLYGLARGAAAPPAAVPRGIFWYGVSALACLMGMATKEVMASAPLMALLYDRTFLAGSFREAVRRRWGYYLALVATWPVFEEALVSSWGRGSFGAGVSPWRYLGTQCGAVAHYLWLCLWPTPLVLDYGRPLAHGAAEIAPYAVLVAALLLATVVALWRWPKLGFLGAFFFVILAPSSSVVPQIRQTIAEHRMYLPLAAVATLVVVAAQQGLRRAADRHCFSRRSAAVLGLATAAAVALALGAATFERNAAYREVASIWRDTLDKVPSNARAQNNLGVALVVRGDLDEAIELFHRALMTDPSEVAANVNYHGNLARLARLDAAIAECRQAVRRRPGSAEAQANLAWRLATCPSAARRNGQAALEHALTAKGLGGGQSPAALDALAAAYAELSRYREAVAEAEEALNLAEKQGRLELAPDIRERMALYRSGKPYRDNRE